jgi:alpha-beta hydrolase superfamily lysophospholipase
LIRAEGRLEFRHSEARGTSNLYRQSWLPDDDARAAVLLVHGLGEHSSRYGRVAEHLTARGLAVHALDHYGHGKSEGQPGYVERFSVYLDGVSALLREIHVQHGQLPVILLGHSMGGLIAASFLLQEQDAFQACVLSGPAFRTDEEPPPIVMAIVRLLAAVVPTVPLLGLDPAGVSRDPEVVRAYVADPLVHHGKLTARLIAEMSKAMKIALARAQTIRLPLLILHGEDDVLTSPAGSVEYCERVSSADTTIKLYPALYHEVFNEPEHQQVLEDMSSWLEDRL